MVLTPRPLLEQVLHGAAHGRDVQRQPAGAVVEGQVACPVYGSADGEFRNLGALARSDSHNISPTSYHARRRTTGFCEEHAGVAATPKRLQV